MVYAALNKFDPMLVSALKASFPGKASVVSDILSLKKLTVQALYCGCYLVKFRKLLRVRLI